MDTHSLTEPTEAMIEAAEAAIKHHEWAIWHMLDGTSHSFIRRIYYAMERARLAPSPHPERE